LCSKKSQVGVKNPKLLKKIKNKAIQQAWNNNFTQNNFYNFTYSPKQFIKQDGLVKPWLDITET